MPKSSVRGPNAKAKGIGGFFSVRKPYIIALFAYVMIAFVLFYPTVIHVFTKVPGIWYSDKYQSFWDIWRVGYSVFTMHQGIWHSSFIFWPSGASMLFETGTPLIALLLYPLSQVSLTLSYNVIFLFGMVFSGLAMMLLSDYLLDNKYAAFIAGVIFAFSAFHIAVAYGDLDWSNIGWIPLSIYFFLRILDKRYWRRSYGKYLNVAALSASFVLMFYAGGVEQMIMTAMAFVVILLCYIASKRSRAMVFNREFMCLMALFVLLFVVFDSWYIAIFIIQFSKSGGLATVNYQNTIANNIGLSDNLLSYITPSFYNGLTDPSAFFKTRYDYNLATDTTYAGFTVLALALLGLYGYRKKLYVWTALCVAFFLLSLGPYVQVGRAITKIPGLYLFLSYIPVLGIIREPGRFAVMVSLALAVIASYGAKLIFEKIRLMSKSQIVRLAVLMALPIIILAETAAPPLTAALVAQSSTKVPTVSVFYSSLASQKGDFAILELPIVQDNLQTDDVLYPAKAMFTTIYSHKPIVGGYISRPSPQDEDSEYAIPLAVQATELEERQNPTYLSPIEENYTNQTILFMKLYNISYVTIDKTAFNSYGLASMEHYMSSVFGDPVYQDNGILAYSTADAVARSLFKGFVGYPELAYWNTTVYDREYFWVPNGNGTIDAYAPYSQANNSIVETQIDMRAVSIGHPSALLKILEGTPDGVSDVASFNLTSEPANYSFDVMLDGGNRGNKLYFTSDYNYSVGISNVSFSLGLQGADAK